MGENWGRSMIILQPSPFPALINRMDLKDICRLVIIALFSDDDTIYVYSLPMMAIENCGLAAKANVE